ncbi:scopoletin glucosyltransferase [Cajanus cajan]|uniref:Anthocyanin 3'-O-beta-glucosyltransferase n=1 Tax=Cajanus cajan TaxID=3821 RepID=A0A151RSM9_CAJCA|nr:scopoletin glucosyltransferase [Cajanus cajan]KYP45560.1 Anthocyanin 3'-O-beta-glucosyltransferase [Cajanus cajan]
MGSSEYHPLHIFFFPMMAPGHMIPTIDMAKLFAEKGVKATVITTPLNAAFISNVIGKANGIHIQTIEFPCAQAGLPHGCENADSIPSPDMLQPFLLGTRLLQEPFEQLLLNQRPHCVVADMFFPWTTDSAAKFGIPRLVFHGTSFFSLCVLACLGHYDDVSSDSDSFVIPNFPGEIRITRMQAGSLLKSNDITVVSKLVEEARESDLRSYGVVVNSFYELEKVYADHYRKVLGRKAWHVGPLSLCNRNSQEKANRGKEASIDERECLKWLDTKKPDSVVYVCFGSMAKLCDSQLRAIATGLEASGQDFIWVVKKNKQHDGEEWVPDGFEKRMEGKGLIIRGWAPQLLILEHEAIGACVTHCGWNSTLEAVTAGVPMVTWPIAAEQFFNEKLVIEVLQIGVPVGSKIPVELQGDIISWESVEKAVNRVMKGEEATQMRNKAKVFSQLAKGAMQEGGSSYSDLNALIQELSLLSH